VGQNPVGDSNIEKWRDRTQAYSQKEWAFCFLRLTTYALRFTIYDKKREIG
jgi:hypothetical protein